MFIFTEDHGTIEKPIVQFGITKIILFFDETRGQGSLNLESLRVKGGIEMEFVPLKVEYTGAEERIREKVIEEQAAGNTVYINASSEIFIFSHAAAGAAYNMPDLASGLFLIHQNRIEQA